MVDIYGNLLISGNEESEVDIIANLIDSNSWPSPIAIPNLTNWQAIYGTNIAGIASTNNDGSYTCQITIFRAGSFNLDV